MEKRRKNSEARIRANNKWTNAHYDRVNIAVPKGWKELIQAAADMHGWKSVNSYVRDALRERLIRDGVTVPVDKVVANSTHV